MRWVLLLIVLSSLCYAVEYPAVLRVELNLKDDLSIISVEKTHGHVEDSQDVEDFRLELVNVLDEVRYERNFTFPHAESVTPLPGCFNEEGVYDTDLCPGSTYKEVTDATIVFDVPYYRTAKSLDIYQGEDLIESYDLSDFTEFCGDGVCSASESPSTCTVDCDPHLESVSQLEVPSVVGGTTVKSPGGKNILIGVLVGVILILVAILVVRNR